MTGGSSIRAVTPAEGKRPDNSGAEATGPAEYDTSTGETARTLEYEEEEGDTPRPPLIASPTATIIALLALAGWTALFVLGRTPAAFATLDLAGWTEAIAAWSPPALLILLAWFAASQRVGRKTAHFRASARAAARDIEDFEARLSVVNGELSLAREFLAQQARELESHGRVAASRLSENADRIEALVSQNGEDVERIARVSETALANMARLRDDLPVITNVSRDAANAIGAAGEQAGIQMEALREGTARLDEFGETGERHAIHFRRQIDQTLGLLADRMSELEARMDARFAALREQSDALRGEIDTREVEALAASHGRIEKLRARLTEAVEEVSAIDERAMGAARERLEGLREEAVRIDDSMRERDRDFAQWLESRRTRLEETEREALSALEARLTTLDDAVAERRDTHAAVAKRIADESTRAADELASVSERMVAIADRAQDARADLVEASETVEARLGDGRAELEALHALLPEVTEAGVRLLELIQAGAQHSRDVLPAAMETAEARLQALRDSSEKLRRSIDDGAERSERLSAYVIEARDTGEEVFGIADRLDDRLARSGETMAEHVASLRTALTSLDEESSAVSEAAGERMKGAVAELDTAAERARDLLARFAREEGRDVGKRVGEEAANAITDTLKAEADDALTELREATKRSANVARDAAQQLRDQLALVNELTGNLETRVSLARERAEEQVDNDFARRVALITESLNSNAIDISTTLSAEVSDTAWTSYLRGDRGIFTRRAVRLLDSTQARDIAELYDEDDDFRDHVNRYIHDFEAMLRTLLSTRDGNALAVTLLGSEVGKLYVALAQALNRLRTA